MKGFYYHYKHDPTGEVNKYAYELIGTARNTENDNFTVLYRPLYKSEFIGTADCFSRPYDMFFENVEKNGKTFPRFKKIDDEDVIKKLEILKSEMYANQSASL